MIHVGDARVILPTLAAQSVAAVVTDPPAGIAFMQAKWDNPWEYGIGDAGATNPGARSRVAVSSNRNPMCRTCHQQRRGRHKERGRGDEACHCDVPDFDDAARSIRARQQFITTMTEIFTECRRVLKPGGFAFVWALPRTSHWTATALEDAGLQIIDVVVHLTGQGFPKSLDVRKSGIKQGRYCACDTGMLEYHHDASSNVSVLPSDVTEDAAELGTDLLLDGMHGAGSPSAAEPQDVHSMRHDMDAGDTLSGGAQSDVLTGLCQSPSQRGPSGQKQGSASAAGHTAMQDVRSPSHQTAGTTPIQPGDVLLTPVCGQGTGQDPGTACSQHEGVQAGRPALRGRQSSLEGRDNLLQDEGQLHGGGVCARPSMGSANGAQGRVYHGASASDGPDVRPSPHPNGSGQPRRSPPIEQRANEPDTMADERGPQAGRGWPLCERCGKPMVPEGLGTALKPASEHWILCRAPLSEPTVAANVSRWGTGALNIDGARLGHHDDLSRYERSATSGYKRGGVYGDGDAKLLASNHSAGRWPPNVAISHTLFCSPVGTRRVRGAGWRDSDQRTTMLRGNHAPAASNGQHYVAPDGTETVEAWACAAGCPVALLDRQSGERKSGGTGNGQTGHRNGLRGNVYTRTVNNQRESDTGGASRFFYVSKASTAERSRGLPGGERNSHPTVKPLALMRWLLTLVVPPGGVVLDPFMGSGSTLVAAAELGIEAIGIEQDAASCAIAEQRIQGVPA